ncbi:MAG: hypothetical protein IPK82_20755 [Polyangiaceae bacterium]|nr:hypothetical protein [Polyangiaceae bacterium]
MMKLMKWQGYRLARGLAALLACLTGCGGLPPNVPRVGEFDARRLNGGWHVLASTFPMWLEGKKTDPNFIYRVIDGTSPVELDDTVAYTEGGRRETIEGIDTQESTFPTHFTWRGKGLLAAFSSDWVVVSTGPEDRYVVLYFTKTLVTPEGVDVIARTPTLSEPDRKAVETLLRNDPFLKDKSRQIVWLGKAGSKRDSP